MMLSTDAKQMPNFSVSTQKIDKYALKRLIFFPFRKLGSFASSKERMNIVEKSVKSITDKKFTKTTNTEAIIRKLPRNSVKNH